MPSHTLVAYVESAARGIKLPVAWFSDCIEVFVILLCTNINGLMSSSIVAMMPTEESKVDQGQAINIIDTYSLCPKISVVLAFKFCPTKSVVLACNEIHLIKAIPSTKKTLYRKTHRANQIHRRCYFSSSNGYAFIEDPENKINNTIFNHNC